MAAHPGARRHRRRRHRRCFHRLPPREARREGRRPARAGQAHVRHDVARRGSRRPDARDAQRDADEPLRHRPLRVARAGDGTRHRLEAVRQPERRADAGAPRVDASGRWRARRASASSSSSSPRPKPASRVPILRTDDLAGAVWIPGDGKANPTDLTQSLAKGARMRGATIVEGVKVTGVDRANGSRRRNPLANRGRRRRDRVRSARQLRRPMGARVRAPGRRQRAALRGRALLPRHQGDRRRDSRHAGDPRSRRLSLLQGGSRRARDGRLRARGQAVERRSDPRRLRVPAACPRTGTSSRS